MLIYVAGIPLGAFYLLWKRAHKLETRHSREKIGYLYTNFANEYYFWELFIMLRLVVFAGIAVMFDDNPQLQAGFALFLISLCLWIQKSCRPYRDELLNFAEDGTLVAAWGTLYGGTLLFNENTTETFKIAVTCMIVAANVLAAVAILCIALNNGKVITSDTYQALEKTWASMAPRKWLSDARGWLSPSTAKGGDEGRPAAKSTNTAASAAEGEGGEGARRKRPWRMRLSGEIDVERRGSQKQRSESTASSVIEMHTSNPMNRHPSVGRASVSSDSSNRAGSAGRDLRAGSAVKRAVSIRSPSTPSFKLKKKLTKEKQAKRQKEKQTMMRKKVATWEEDAKAQGGGEEEDAEDGTAAATAKNPRWKSAVDGETGLTYYFSRETGETQWGKPRGFAEEGEEE